jgi:hypothetical protein
MTLSLAKFILRGFLPVWSWDELLSTCAAYSTEWNSTKAMPRDMPLVRSRTTKTLFTGAYCRNVSATYTSSPVSIVGQ